MDNQNKADCDDEGDCTAGLYIPLHTAKEGDTVVIGTADGKTWRAKVKHNYDRPFSNSRMIHVTHALFDCFIYFENENEVRRNLYFKDDALVAYVDALPDSMHNDKYVEFSNFDRDDEKGVYILTCIAAHIRHWSDEDKDKLIRVIQDDIFKLRPLIINKREPGEYDG
jgi:hypothetical protein